MKISSLTYVIVLSTHRWRYASSTLQLTSTSCLPPLSSPFSNFLRQWLLFLSSALLSDAYNCICLFICLFSSLENRKLETHYVCMHIQHLNILWALLNDKLIVGNVTPASDVFIRKIWNAYVRFDKYASYKYTYIFISRTMRIRSAYLNRNIALYSKPGKFGIWISKDISVSDRSFWLLSRKEI